MKFFEFYKNYVLSNIIDLAVSAVVYSVMLTAVYVINVLTHMSAYTKNELIPTWLILMLGLNGVIWAFIPVCNWIKSIKKK